MRDPIRSALRADTKAWSVGLVVIAFYLGLSGSGPSEIKAETHLVQTVKSP